MGQKINPNGFRLPSKKTVSLWYMPIKKYAYYVKQDNIALRFFNTKIEAFGINKLRIKQTLNKNVVIIHIHTQYPNLLLNLPTLINYTPYKQKPIILKIFKLEEDTANINVLASLISEQIRERISFQRIVQIVLLKLEKTFYKGLKIQLSGRLNGIEKAKTEWYKEGRLPLNTVQANIQYTQKTIKTKYGSIGLKLWLLKT